MSVVSVWSRNLIYWVEAVEFIDGASPVFSVAFFRIFFKMVVRASANPCLRESVASTVNSTIHKNGSVARVGSMNWRLAVLIAIGLVILIAYWRVSTRPAFRQKPSEVVFREPGERTLGLPQPIAAQARIDVDFALLSQAAYQRVPAKKKDDEANCDSADAALEKAGWSRWTDFPDSQVQAQIQESHLRVEVWSNASRQAVAVAFGGTVATSGKDWRSNLRWFIPGHTDEYTEIIQHFSPALRTEFAKRRQQPEWAFLQHADLFSTGHSLGGGLAQEFAYSLPDDPNVRRVKKVFAFDPSPVTGFYSVDSRTRDQNIQTLAIDRIYERGEILAILRSLINFIVPPSATTPVIRQVRYNLFYTRNPFAGHSIAELACKLQEASR